MGGITPTWGPPVFPALSSLAPCVFTDEGEPEALERGEGFVESRAAYIALKFDTPSRIRLYLNKF